MMAQFVYLFHFKPFLHHAIVESINSVCIGHHATLFIPQLGVFKSCHRRPGRNLESAFGRKFESDHKSSIHCPDICPEIPFALSHESPL